MPKIEAIMGEGAAEDLASPEPGAIVGTPMRDIAEWWRVEILSNTELVVHTDVYMVSTAIVDFETTIRRVRGVISVHVDSARFGPMAVLVKHSPVFSDREITEAVVAEIGVCRSTAIIGGVDLRNPPEVPNDGSTGSDPAVLRSASGWDWPLIMAVPSFMFMLLGAVVQGPMKVVVLGAGAVLWSVGWGIHLVRRANGRA